MWFVSDFLLSFSSSFSSSTFNCNLLGQISGVCQRVISKLESNESLFDFAVLSSHNNVRNIIKLIWTMQKIMTYWTKDILCDGWYKEVIHFLYRSDLRLGHCYDSR